MNMKRILVVSDIHGELDLFEKLLKKVKYHSEKDQLVLVGDYVDRGPNSRGVLNKVMNLKRQGAIVLRGNHDEMFIDAVNNEENAWRRWKRNGGLVTLKSYGKDINTIEDLHTVEFRKHVQFIQSLEYYYETDDYIFVHAGLEPGTPLAKTDPNVLVWIREDFYNHYKGDKIVIFGHTRAAKLHQDDHNNAIFFGENNLIGIDGGAVYGGQLNCLELPSRKEFSVKNI